MKIIDLNVLLYAVNRDAANHAAALDWWQKALNGDESVGLPWLVVLGFLRIATNPKIFPSPLSAADAIKKVETWLAVTNVCVVTEKPEHWMVLRGLLEESGVAGNLTTDAHVAALAITHGARLASFDRDFDRFDGLRWENPATS